MDLAFELENTASWRDEKAERYPEDVRNAQAAELLRTLSSQTLSSDISARLSKAWSTYEDAFDGAPEDATIDPMEMAEGRTSETFRSVGFSFHPKSLDDVAEMIVTDIELATDSVRESLKSA